MNLFFIQRILILSLWMAPFLFIPQAKGQDSLRIKKTFFSKMFFPDSTQLVRYRVVPFINYSPETRLGFGAGVIVNWDYKNAAPKTNSSLAQSFFIYTQNNQIDWTSKFEIFTNKNQFSFSGSIGYIRFPQYYFGVGNYIPFDQREKFSYQQLYFDIKSRILVRKGLYLGIDYYFNSNYDVQWPEGSQFEDDPSLYGTEGYLISGIGPEVVWDTRDFPLNPSKGSFISASILFFKDLFGSEYSYNYYQLDLRHFFLLNKKKRWVLAVQLYGLFADGEAPFNRLPALGGPQIMRGYYSGRFRDHNYIAGQLEWRMPVWRFIGITAWVGTGQVSNSFNEFSWEGFKPNVGLGLRFILDKRSKMNVRADQGFGTNTQGFYLRINEAF